MRSAYTFVSSVTRVVTTVMVLGLLLVPALSIASSPCVVTGSGGTVNLPPIGGAGCGYLSPNDVHMIINGLPPGTTVQLGAQHHRFANVVITPDSLGGATEQFQSFLDLNLKGTGSLAGYHRQVSIPTNCLARTGPRTPGQPVQSFDTEMLGIQGQLPPGDPDFDLLRVTAGSNFGMPSPGHTTLTRQGNSNNWNVDSFFDITYRIDFVGHSPGPFAGMSGSTTATIRMQSGQPPPPPCVVPDAGGTAMIPPVGGGCGYLSPNDVHMIINGLPPGTTIKVGAEHQDFFNVQHQPGGPLGGETEQFQSALTLHLQGTGTLTGLNRNITIPTQCQSHVGPRTPGQVVQSFDTQMAMVQGQITGDPDFDLLRVTAGNAFGMPSPGHTTLTRLPGGNWNVDSFFDITYRIDFVGAAGGPLAGRSGSTTATIRMQAGQTVPPPVCLVPDDGTGTVFLPPDGCPYLSPADVHQILDGLPAGTSITLGAQHDRFINKTNSPGGSLGGEVETFDSNLLLQIDGTGSLSNFHRVVAIGPSCETHIGPRTPGQPVQSFDTEMFRLQGQLPPGDPDFDLLRITAGSGFGLPSPGHTTLTRSGPVGSDWNVDSFFDITYRIDYVGRPGGALSGMSGSTTGTIRMQTGQPQQVGVPGPVNPKSVQLSNRPNPFGEGTTIEYRLPMTSDVKLSVYDAAGHLVRSLVNTKMPVGPHAMFWDGRNNTGRKLGSGTYFVKLSVNGKLAASRRVTMIR